MAKRIRKSSRLPELAPIALGELTHAQVRVAMVFSLVASGQIKLRRIDGWRKIATVLSQHAPVAAR